MRRCRAALTVLTLSMLSMLVAGPASAGGPTSVLLVVPGAGDTASLYTDDPLYDTLARQVGAFEASGVAGDVDRSGAGHEVGTPVTVTWLIHDVQVWRVDRIYLAAGDGPWISTQVVPGGSDSVWDSSVVWHTAADGKGLMLLLGELGLTGGTGIAPPEAADRTPGQAPGRAADATTPDEGGSAWWLAGIAGLVGIALGGALGIAPTRLRPASRPTDERAAQAGPDGDLDWELTDELSSRPTDVRTSDTARVGRRLVR